MPPPAPRCALAAEATFLWPGALRALRLARSKAACMAGDKLYAGSMLWEDVGVAHAWGGATAGAGR
eukprot:scaffold22447_cov29-Tisochrysis_lutea.AAC.4